MCVFLKWDVQMMTLQMYYWFVIHSYHGEDKNWKEEWARAFGIYGSMFYALAFLPITRRQSNNNPFGGNSILNNPFQRLFGLSFETILNYHKCMGILFLIFGVLHVIYWEAYLHETGNYNDCKFMPLLSCLYSGNNPSINTQYYIYIVGIIPCYLILPSYWIRRIKFELFYYSHIIGGFIILGGMLWHCNDLIYWLYPCIVFYIFDRINRWFMSNRQANVIDCQIINKNVLKLDFVVNGVKYDDYLRLRESGNNSNFIRDDFVFLKIDQLSMMQWHPFSIFCVKCDIGSNDAVYSVCISNNGNFTNDLYELVNKIEKDSANNDAISFKMGLSFGITLSVDGPYGGEINCLPYHTIFLIAGGIGITPIHFIFDGLIDRNNNFFNSVNNESPLNVVLIWCLRDENLSDTCKETFEKARELKNFRVLLFNTSSESNNNSVAREKGYLIMRSGRPDLQVIVEEYCHVGLLMK